MKVYLLPTAIASIFLAILSSCAPKSYSHREYMGCPETTSESDTSKIIYESLVRTIAEQLVDFGTMRDKRNIFVLDKYFLSGCSNQDTSGFTENQNVRWIPHQIGYTRFCLKSLDEIKRIAHREEAIVYALQIGFITIKGDTAITGMQTFPVKGTVDKRVLLSGSGTHLLFKKVDKHWLYIGTAFCNWISKKKNIGCRHTANT